MIEGMYPCFRHDGEAYLEPSSTQMSSGTQLTAVPLWRLGICQSHAQIRRYWRKMSR